MKRNLVLIALLAACLTGFALSDVVIDLGARRIVCGYVGEDTPNVAFEGVVALPLSEGEEPVVGVAAHDKYEDHTLVYPTSYVNFNNSDIDSLDILIEKCLRDLGNNTGMEVIPTDHRAMVIGTLLNNSRYIRQRVADVLFNKFHFTALNFQNSLLLALHYSGRSTGVVINIDDDATSFATIYEGKILNYQDLGYGQATVIKKISEELLIQSDLGDDIPREEIEGNRGYNECLTLYLRRCAVSHRTDNELFFFNNEIHESYTLSSGKTIPLRRLIFSAGELYIRPGIAGLEDGGIPRETVRLINKCPAHTRSFLLSNIILTGHGSLMPGLDERLQKEISMEASTLTNRVRSFAYRQYGGWMGAQVFANSPMFENELISQEDYNSIGESVIN